MSWRKILSLVCPIASAVCLAVAYAQVGRWIALAIVLLTFLAWLLARKRPSIGLSSTALVISVGLAAAGLFAGASPFLMMLSATFALASWDLVLLDHTLTDDSNSSAKTIALFENRHYQSLALALGLGLLVAVTGQLIHLQIPLGGMILLVILALFGLDRVWRALVD
jgi:hypothetical protein